MGTPLVSVRIDRSGQDSYAVVVSVHGAGPGAAPFTGEFAKADLPRVPGIAIDGTATDPALGAAGQGLYDVLAGCGLGQAWADGETGPLLLDIRDPDLAQIPWELLRNGPLRHFAQRSAPAARGRLPGIVVPAPAPVPVRLLVVVDSATDDDVLQQVDEIEAIHEGLASVPCGWQVEVLRGPCAQEFYAEYESFAPDVLHVIGHAAPTWEGRALVMRPARGDEWPMTAEYLVGTLPDGRAPRLVVLNACRTADRSNEAVRYARGLADALLDSGVAAVVSMQGDVASTAAAVFSRSLYRSLAAGEPLHVAAAEARFTVANANGAEPRDWALPILEVRADPALVLRQELAVDPVEVIRLHDGFDMVRRMVDRAPQRRRLQDSQLAAGPGGPGGLVFITGEGKVGKTMLARTCAVSRAIAGAPVVYYSPEVYNVSTADYLLNLVKATHGWLGDRAAEPCAATEAALRSLFGLPGAPAATSGGARSPFITLPRPNAAGGPAVAGYSMVTDLLGTLGKPRPVVLVLDHLGLVQDRTELLSGLLLPAAKGLLTHVQVIVVERSSALVGIAGERGQIPITEERNISVENFTRAQTDSLVREYLARSRPGGVDAQVWAELRRDMIAWSRDRMRKRAPAALYPVEIDLAVQQKRAMYGLGLS